MRLFAAKSNFWKADPLCTLLSEVSLIHNKVTLIMHVHIQYVSKKSGQKYRYGKGTVTVVY